MPALFALIHMVVCCCIGPVFFLVGVGLIYYGTQRYLLMQKIKNLPTSKVRSAAVGLVELAGKAKCKDAMASPISKAKCIYWRVKGEYYYQHRKNSGWRDCYNKHSSMQFYLEDDTGKMLIEPKDGEVDIPSDLSSTGHLTDKALFGLLSQKQLDQKVLAYMNADSEFGNALRAHSGTNLRVTEYYIAEGDPLYVLGTAAPVAGASSAIANENLTVQKSKSDGILYVSDSGETNVLNKIMWSIPLPIIFGTVFAIGGIIASLSGVATAGIFLDMFKASVLLPL